MSKNLWNSLLVNPAMLGAALVVSASALATETPVATQAAKLQLVEAENLVVRQDASLVSTTSTVEPIRTTAMEKPIVADIEAPLSVTTSEQDSLKAAPLKPSAADSAQSPKSIAVTPPTAPTADNSPTSAQRQVAEMPGNASDTGVLEQINQYSDESGEDSANSLDQVTNVTQLRDVSPNDWAFEALRSLVERYGCIAGYPDGTYRGNRAMSRYEFAAGLNACLQQVERILKTSTEGFATKQDLAAIQRLVTEFGPELAVLRGKVDALEARTAELEATQFSTTTKLNAEVVFALAGIASGDRVNGFDVNKNTVLGYRARLNLDTSFTGEDLLRTRLQSVNLDAFSGSASFTPEGDLRFAGAAYENGNDNSVGIDALLYQFPIGKKTTVIIEANAGAPDDFTNTVNPYLDGDGGSGALTHFGTRNPIYYLLNGSGIGFKHEFSDKLELSLGYLANDPANPGPGGGLFNGPYGALAQLTIKPIEKLTLGLTYIHAYNNDFTANGSSGSNRANLRSALLNNPNLPAELAPLSGLSLPTSSNAYGLQASWQFNPNLVLGGWVGYTAVRTLSTGDGTVDRGDLSIWNWAVTLAAPDLGKKGNVAGVIVGMEPKVTSVSTALRNALGEDPDTSLHIEGFYQLQLTDNIAITPGIIWLTAPDHNADNDDIVIGTIRTTFTF